jgi:hypothetical protein
LAFWISSNFKNPQVERLGIFLLEIVLHLGIKTIHMLRFKFYAALFIFSSLFLFSCNGIIKNDNPKVVEEEGTVVDNINTKEPKKVNKLLGSYVGMFEIDEDIDVKWDKAVTAGESFHWLRENKISLSIDSIEGTIIKGQTVVAGNERPFAGTITKTDSGFVVEAKEPGDKKEDGVFNFTLKDTIIEGTWKAFAKIDISNRKYELVKREFVYNPNQLLRLNQRYVDWTKPKPIKIDVKGLKAMKDSMSKEELEEYEEYEKYDQNAGFASSTEKIYALNASTTLLTEKQVANLSKGDLSIIRNTIYARHGYSFKNRPLRVFFDRQTWYIPVNTNIKNAFTEVEKKNITLLLKYEKVAKEFYDYFGRG